MPAYYNEIDEYAADWLRQLIRDGHIAPGDVDTRSIVDVRPEDLRGYTQCHFFAGIGGWSIALRLAGWPDDRPVWTGSCPCQPFSAAGKQEGEKDERHLWPEFYRLIRECRPATIFGEQVASAIALGWLDGVFADLEGAGYACGAADLCAAGIGAPHIRQRLFWMAVAAMRGQRGGRGTAGQDGPEATDDCGTDRLEHREGDRRHQGRAESDGRVITSGCRIGGVVNGIVPRLEGHAGDGDDGNQSGRIDTDATGSTAPASDPCADFRIVRCRDGKYRRISAKPGDEPLAHGIPIRMGPMLARLDGMGRSAIKAARRNRVGRLKGYGNAIVPQVAAAFIRAAGR